jgi:hypothetical protein
MKVKDLIKTLQTFDENTNVDISNKAGNFYNIGNVWLQSWTSREGKLHKSVTIDLAVYKPEDSFTGEMGKDTSGIKLIDPLLDKCYVGTDVGIGDDMTGKQVFTWETPNFLKMCETRDEKEEVEKEDKEFIDDVNKTIIDKEEAVEAKESYNNDKKKSSDKILTEYDKYAKEASRILFGADEGFLNDYSMEKLLSFITKNNWIDEIDKELLTDKMSVLKFLYHKLEDKIKELLTEESKYKDSEDYYEFNFDELKDMLCSIIKQYKV